jgi:signal peptidase I
VAQPVRQIPEAQPPEHPEAGSASPKSVAREYGEAMLIAVVLAIVIRTFILQAYKIPSGSMEPTLLVGDHILVNKLAYGLRMPDSLFGFDPMAGVIPYGHYLLRFGQVHRDDVVVFVFPPDPTKDFIKRVIGLPGDQVAVKDGVVYIDGKAIPDPHAHYELPLSMHNTVSPRDNFGPVTVPAGHYFMMGDNRDRSWDSRFWGFVAMDKVEGRAVVIYWSWNTDSSSWIPLRWSRFGKLID